MQSWKLRNPCIPFDDDALHWIESRILLTKPYILQPILMKSTYSWAFFLLSFFHFLAVYVDVYICDYTKWTYYLEKWSSPTYIRAPHVHRLQGWSKGARSDESIHREKFHQDTFQGYFHWRKRKQGSQRKMITWKDHGFCFASTNSFMRCFALCCWLNRPAKVEPLRW